jgi:hypothetical protein
VIRMKRFVLILSLAACFLSLASVSFAKDVVFQATVDRNRAGVGQAIELNLIFEGTQEMPPLTLPAIDGFQARYIGPSARMSVINGQTATSITHIYALLPTKVGTFQIGPFQFEHKGDTYRCNPISIEVVESPPPGDPSVANAPPGSGDLSDRIFLFLQIPRDKVYLNEVFPVTIKLYIQQLGVRDIQMPQWIQDGFSVGQFEQPRQYQEVVNGVGYHVVDFSTTAFGLRPGEFRLGPVSLQCNLLAQRRPRRSPSPTFDDLFNLGAIQDLVGGYQVYTVNLRSRDIPLTVMPLPEENKPADFSGALGVFSMDVSVDPREVKVGDPITLRAVIRGQGNLSSVEVPKADLGDAFKVYEPQVKQDKETKIFEQVLIPLNAQVTNIPAFRLSFFNVQTGQYETIAKGPFPLKVTKPDKEEELRIVEGKSMGRIPPKEEKLGRDIIYIKETLGSLRVKGEALYKNRIFLGAQALPLLLYLFLSIVAARDRRLRTDIRFARQLSAPRKAKAGIRRAQMLLEKGDARDFCDALFETLQEYLGDKFHLPSQAITASVIEEQLRHKGLSDEVLATLKEIFSACDRVRYAASTLTRENMKDALKKLEESIDTLQRIKV